jgi:hypothetical protein
VMYPESASEPLPNLELEFGDTVPLVAPAVEPVEQTVAPILKPLVGSVTSVIPVSLGGF